MDNENEMLYRHADMWVTEKYKDLLRISYRIKKTLYSERSDFQQIDMVDTLGYGKMLLNDGLVMVTERDEFAYHDMIAHVPLFVHPDPKKVLVIGGGDGGTIREVLRHKSVEKACLIEIDPCVLEACEKHIPQMASALKDKRCVVRVEDGVKFVSETKDRFDVIIIDSTDPIGPATPLFGEEFYKNVKGILKDKNGIVVSQGESPFYGVVEQKSLLKVLKTQFERVHMYNFSNMTYPGGLWSFTFSSDAICPIADFKRERVKLSKMEFQYYNADIHKGAFFLPQFQRENFKGILSDLPGEF